MRNKISSIGEMITNGRLILMRYEFTEGRLLASLRSRFEHRGKDTYVKGATRAYLLQGDLCSVLRLGLLDRRAKPILGRPRGPKQSLVAA